MAMMTQLIRSFGSFFQEYPLVFLICIFPFVYYLYKFKILTDRLSKNYLIYAGLTITGVFILIVIFYVSGSGFIDHVNSTISLITFKYIENQHIYPANDDGQVYSLMYGPLLYLINSLFYIILPNSFFTIKLPGVLALVVTLFGFNRTLSNYSKDKFDYIISNFLLVGCLLFFEHYSFWIMGDSFLLALLSLGIYANTWKNSHAKFLTIFVLLGISVNIKVHTCLYYLPLLVYQIETEGWNSLKYQIIYGVVSIIIVLLPFAEENISLVNYIFWLSSAAQHGIVFWEVIKSQMYLLFYVSPLLIIVLYSEKPFGEFKYTLITLIVSLFIINILGSKHGSSAGHHMLPMFPFIIYLIWNLTEKYEKRIYKSTFFIAFTTVIIINGLFTELFLFSRIRYAHRVSEQVISDMTDIIQRYEKKSIAMGYGGEDNYHLTYYRPLLNFDRDVVLLEPPVLMDIARLGEVKNNKNTLELLSNCESDIWLIPKGDDPFVQKTWFAPYRNLFSKDFQNAFADNYYLLESSKYYDLYTCK